MHVCMCCDRANCIGCADENEDSVECVKTCADWGGLEHEWGCYDTYCTDCRVKACEEKDWTQCCPVCVRKIAPVLVSENEKLREQLVKNQSK